MSGDDAGPSHAQAVRFLTSLRAENAPSSDHIHLTDEQRAFLHSKGLSDDAIERARLDAERPASAALVQASRQAPLVAPARDASAFDRAKEAFDAPLGAETPALSLPPAPPPASYPRSPLALYAEAPQQRDANEILSQLAATISRPRYDTLVTFFRLLYWLLTLGGSASAVLVWLYRRHVLPRLTRMVDARVQLVTLQRDLWSKFAEAASAYREGTLAKLLPPHYEPEYLVVEPAVEEAPDAANEPGAGSPVEAPTPETLEKEMTTSPDSEPSDAPPTSTDVPSTEPAEPAAPAEPRRVLAPIDLTQSLRASLDELQAALRAAHAARTPPPPTTEDNDEGLMDLSMPAAGPGSPRAMAPSASAQRFRTSLDSMRQELEARLFSEAEAIKVVEHRFGALAASSTRGSSGPAVEMRQIKAEIRSLKGLMLSRRNFPSYQRAARSTPQLST